ncbi:hypothetical protein RDI58_008215 [Solanum bulbocastanum]
MAREIGS